MAIKKDIVILDDVAIDSAYIRILAVLINYERKLVKISLGCWKSKAAYSAGKKQLPLEILVEVSPEIVCSGDMMMPAVMANIFPHVELKYSDAAEISSKENLYQLLKNKVAFFNNATITSD